MDDGARVIVLGKVNLLFTGGLDSTYRLCRLAREKDVVVQPIYIVFPNRPETEREILAQEKVLSYVSSRPGTVAEILPVDRVRRDDIPKDKRILDLELPLAEYGLGWQFLYIALYAKWNPGLELCQEEVWETFPKTVRFVEKDGHTVMDAGGAGELFTILFKDLYFPILGVSRRQMADDLAAWGYDGIWELIWFCYGAIDGEPCGICDNCRKKITDGLRFLFSDRAMHRYLVYRYIWNMHPLASVQWYSEYCRNGGYLSMDIDSELRKNMSWFYRKYELLDKLSNKKLKEILVNGSFKYGYRTVLKEKIRNFRYDTERRKSYEALFRRIGV